MKRWNLGRVSDVPIQADWTAILFLVWLAMSRVGDQGEHLLDGLMFAVVIFMSIFIHEMGHAIVGRRLGLRPIRVLIHGFGGLCQYDRAPQGLQGVLVSLAGPAAGLALALGAYLLGTSTRGWVPIQLTWWATEWVTINLFWSLFNLLPMYPLDGGSVVLHGLETRVPFGRALTWTRWASLVTAALVGYLAYTSGQTFISVLAALIALQNLPSRG